MTCRECKLFDIESAKNKRGHVMKKRTVKCLWVSKEQYPLSVGPSFDRPQAGYVTSESGHRCPCFQRR